MTLDISVEVKTLHVALVYYINLDLRDSIYDSCYNCRSKYLNVAPVSYINLSTKVSMTHDISVDV